ncbi:MAG: polyphosphate kinase 1 [Treponema sp.]|nr:polyphosphate kinase 1 [Treponema sp.]
MAETDTLLSRDLSWIDFNERVLEEGLRKDLPLLERLRFLAIVSTNFDEFFMVRVAALKRMLQSNTADQGGLSPAQQLKNISEKVHSIIKRQYDCFRDEIFPGLASNGLTLLRPDSYSVPQMDYLESYFMGQIYPILTPLRIEKDEPLPFIESRVIYAAFLLAPENRDDPQAADQQSQERIVIVKLPSVLNRIIWLPETGESTDSAEKEKLYWVLLDDVTLTWGSYLFQGFEVCESMLFKINRDADFSVDEKRDEDFIVAMEEVLEGREKSDVVRMVCSPGSYKIKNELAERFSLEAADLYELNGPINTVDLLELMNVAGFEELHEKPWKIQPVAAFTEETPIWDRISQGDVMLHLPYQSFDPVVRFFREAAADPQVVSIKTTLYRTGGAIPGAGISRASSAYSPVVRALEQAALNGKHVTAVVELKARFDEERNISWAQRLEKAGVIVVYGLSRLKVHAKTTMVMRHENDRIKRYVHLSTGNYNDQTAKYYEDYCLFTCREDIAYDAGLLFNMLTGYSTIQPMMRLAIAPASLKIRLLELIERETSRAGQQYSGRIMAKLNALTDTDIINALYTASQAGVKILLCVRGICTLIPGLAGVSENIRVISVIDHYLEHSRICYFANGGAEELYLSSADWMPRNLERRVELLFPVQDEKIRAQIRDTLNDYFQDNCQARVLSSSGTWARLQPAAGEKPFRIQKEILSEVSMQAGSPGQVKQEFIVRRSPPGEKLSYGG